MKKILKMMVIVMVISILSGCSAVIADEGADYSNKTLTGQISEIDGSKLTLELGKLKKNKETQETTGQAPMMPEGFDGQLPEDFDGELPEDFNGQPPMMQGQTGEQGGQMMEGNRPEKPQDFNGQRPQMENGEMPELPDGQMPQLPEGEMPEDFNGQMPQGFPGQMDQNKKTTYTFEKKSDTASIDVGDVEVTLSDGSIGTVDDLKVGDVVQITVDGNNKVTSLTVYEISETTQSE